jgi:FlaG/FlaF family flagellin (archaellin)
VSLRSFHLLFIALSVILAAYFAAWSGGQYQLQHDLVYAASAALSTAAGCGMALYGAAFQRKTRNL